MIDPPRRRSSVPLLACSLALAVVMSSGVALADAPREEPSTLRAAIDAARDGSARARLAAHHELLTREPHTAGSPGDARMIETLARTMEDMGLDVDTHEIWAYLPVHERSLVEVHAADLDAPLTLPLQERGVEGDPWSASDAAEPAWNAYSGSGDVKAGVVYVNYGRAEDFGALREMGVSVEGKIAIARYGRIYRGHKARYAEQAGAAGMILYTDPDDSGYRRGIPYPEGGWANEHSIQRGSVKSLTYPGDPLTPFEPATKDAQRLDPKDAELLDIPVQAIGWGAAHEILSRMSGRGVPRGWQGGLPFAYRVTDGGDVEVRLLVEQRREIRKTANVVGRITGAVHPDEIVVFGCHFDAWTFGAGDPHAGTIVLLEIARSFAEAARAGRRPQRTLVFAHWGAEEFGIIGSTEWVEAHRDDLERAVAYVNLDMAAMGPNFSSSASPLLKRAIVEATRSVKDPTSDDGQTVHELWIARHGGDPRFGDLGGGSDHLGFYAHLGVPSCGFGAWGSRGVSYHSNYETLAWYRKVVGDDYAPAEMLSKIGVELGLLLADAPLVPYDVLSYAPDTRRHLDGLSERFGDALPAVALAPLHTAIDAYEERAKRVDAALGAMRNLEATAGLDASTLAKVNAELVLLERAWLREDGLPDRPWFRNLFAATDPTSGYAPWMLPLLRGALERGDAEATVGAITEYVEVFEHLDARLARIETVLGGRAPKRASYSR